MTSLSSPQPPSIYHAFTQNRSPTHPLPSLPVAFSPVSGRRSRTASPPPMIVQPRAYATPSAQKDRSSSSDEEIFPPSISQRHTPARSHQLPHRARGVEMGRLMLPTESDHALKEKRSFERTRKWAEDAEDVRRAGMADERYEETEGSMEGLVSDRSNDGSTSSPIPPRTPSPIRSAHNPPRLSLTLPSEKQAPILSIDDIIRQHSGSAQTAMVAATARARKELGLAPSTVSSPSSPSTGETSKPVTPRPSYGQRTASKSASPQIPPRTSSSPVGNAHIVPSRSSSIPNFRAGPGTPATQPSSPLHSPVQFTSALSDHRSIYPTPAPSRSQKPHPSLPPNIPNRSQSTLSSSWDTDIAIPGAPKTRPATTRSSTAPPSTYAPQPDQAHEMALHLRSEPLNKFFIFPRPYPDRPLRVSYSEVGKADGYPVLVFLGVGCVRYLLATYDQLALVYGLRLICVDRWGYGKTDQVEQVDRGLVEWSAVIAQVVAKLEITKFQIIAHSAGTPYAMAVARRFPEKIRGRVHLLAPWVGQDHDNVSKWLKWVPGGVIRTATAADHRLQTYFLGKAPRLQYAPISFNARVTPPLPISTSTDSELSVEELEDIPKSTSLIRRASTVFSNASKPRSRSIYGAAASASTITLSLPPPGASSSASIRRPEPTRRISLSPDKSDAVSVIGRSPALKNLAAMRSAQVLSSSESRGTSSSTPSSEMLATPDQSRMAISASELDFGLGEGFGSFATDLGLAMPVLDNTSKAEQVHRREESNSSGAISRSTSAGTSGDRSMSTPWQATTFPPVSQPETIRSTSILPESRFPSDPAFSTALSQASHAECEPGTTSDILRIILNKPHRPWGFRYEDVVAPTYVWIGEEDKIISKESIAWMEEVCGSTVDRRVGEGHNLMSSPSVLVDLFRKLGEEAREGKRTEEREERDRVEAVEKDRADRWRDQNVQRTRGGW